jgi:hypothetical protein
MSLNALWVSAAEKMANTSNASITPQQTAERSNVNNPDGNQGMHDHTLAAATTKWLNLKSTTNHLMLGLCKKPGHETGSILLPNKVPIGQRTRLRNF